MGYARATQLVGGSSNATAPQPTRVTSVKT